MFTTEFEVVMVVVAFLVGTFWGPTVLAWGKSWFVKEEHAVVTKVTGSGPTGATGA
jgi:hypothetical protein